MYRRVDRNAHPIDSLCGALYSQPLCMGPTIILCHPIRYIFRSHCHVVWCFYTFGVCRSRFWSPSTDYWPPCTNTPDPTSNSWSALVLGIAYQHAGWRTDAFCRHLYRALFHLQVHLERSVLLHVWLFDARVPHFGVDNSGNCHCHYVFQFMQRGNFDDDGWIMALATCSHTYIYVGLSMVVEIVCSVCSFGCLCILVSAGLMLFKCSWLNNTTLVVCRYSIFYYFTRLKVTGFVPAIVYFGHSLMICMVYGLCMGTIGFFATFFFIRKIYAAIKVNATHDHLYLYCLTHAMLDRQL